MHDSIQKWQQKMQGLGVKGMRSSSLAFAAIADYTTMGKCYECEI